MKSSTEEQNQAMTPQLPSNTKTNYTHPQQKLAMVSTNTSETWPKPCKNNKRTTTTIHHFLKQTNKTTNQFSLGTVAEDKVTNIINDLKSKNSSGFDNVSNKLP
jgi:hypothetical protein